MRIRNMCVQINRLTTSARSLLVFIVASSIARSVASPLRARARASDVYFHRAWITADKFTKEILPRACFSHEILSCRGRERLPPERCYKCYAMNFVRRAFLPAFQDKIARTIWRGYAFTITASPRIAYVNSIRRIRVSNWIAFFFSWLIYVASC